MKEETLPKKTLPFILLGLLVALFIGGYVFLLARIGRAQERATTFSQQVRVEIEREKQARETGRFLENIQEEESRIRSFFIARDSVVDAIETIETLGGIVGAPVTLRDVRVDGQDETHAGTLTFDISSSGSWTSQSKLLLMLERLPFHAEVYRVALNGNPGGVGTPSTWSLQASVRAELSNN